MNPCLVSVRRLLPPTLVAMFAALAPTVHAFVFNLGEVKGSFDTTVSVGGLYRVGDQDPAMYGITNTANGKAGLQRSVNADDGNLNYDKGIASSLVKVSSDLQLDYKNAGLFARGYIFNDFTNSNGTREHVPLSDEANDIVSEGGELLDLYAYLKGSPGGRPAVLRVGQQVLSWGESTFRSEEHTSELQSQSNLVCRLLLEKKKKKKITQT